MFPMLGSKAGGAPGALVKLDNDDNFLEAHPAPDYMYDVGVKPELNLIVTSSWALPHAVKAGTTPMTQGGAGAVAGAGRPAKALLDGKVPYRVRLVNVGPSGMTLDAKFDVDFEHFPTGQARPHDMLLK